jgi:Ca2+-transporting ATPase
MANLGSILTNRSWSRTIIATLRTPNFALWLVIAGTAAVLGLVLYTPFLRDLFKFKALHTTDLWICLGAAATSIFWFEALKFVNAARKRA